MHDSTAGKWLECRLRTLPSWCRGEPAAEAGAVSGVFGIEDIEQAGRGERARGSRK